MFASSEDFGLTVLVILDNHLQKFFEMVSEMDDATKASTERLPLEASERFPGRTRKRRPPSVVIPQCLHRNPTVHKEGKGPATPTTKKLKASSAEKGKERRATTNKEP
jgi:hypothetical protein